MLSSSIDYNILEWIHHHRIESLDVAVQWFSSATTYISLGIILVTAIFSFVRKEGLRKPLQLIATLLVVALLSFTIKIIIDRERPFQVYDSIEKLSSGGSPSFPSGHTFEAFAMATAVFLLFSSRKIRIPIIIWAFLVGYSRMALGVHYPTDVLAGMVLGIFTAVGIDFVFRRYFNHYFTQN